MNIIVQLKNISYICNEIQNFKLISVKMNRGCVICEELIKTNRILFFNNIYLLMTYFLLNTHTHTHTHTHRVLNKLTRVNYKKTLDIPKNSLFNYQAISSIFFFLYAFFHIKKNLLSHISVKTKHGIVSSIIYSECIFSVTNY